MIWFSADHHFGHANIIKYCDRPFSSVEEMDAEMIERWNTTIAQKDIVYYLGDMSFHPERYIGRLNGQFRYIWGNHDGGRRVKRLQAVPNVLSTHRILTVQVHIQTIVLCHFAMRAWHKSHFNSWHLYGHSHGTLEGQGKSFDVGVDAHHFFPWSWEEIVVEMSQRPDNMNLVERD